MDFFRLGNLTDPVGIEELGVLLSRVVMSLSIILLTTPNELYDELCSDAG